MTLFQKKDNQKKNINRILSKLNKREVTNIELEEEFVFVFKKDPDRNEINKQIKNL